MTNSEWAPAGSARVLLVETRQHPEGLVYRLTVSHPEKLNIVDTVALAEISDVLARVAEDDTARAVILSGSGGKAWIGGADINEMVALNSESAKTFISGLHAVCQALRELPVPVIASIDGFCLGAGLEIAACCDLRIATSASRFGMPEVQVGIPSVIEAALLPRLIGVGRTRDLVLTGRTIDAREASAWGLIECVDSTGRLDTVVNDRIAMILTAGPKAIRAQKALCRDWEELPLSQAIKASVDVFGDAFLEDEPQAYMQRFLRGRRK